MNSIRRSLLAGILLVGTSLSASAQSDQYLIQLARECAKKLGITVGPLKVERIPDFSGVKRPSGVRINPPSLVMINSGEDMFAYSFRGKRIVSYTHTLTPHGRVSSPSNPSNPPPLGPFIELANKLLPKFGLGKKYFMGKPEFRSTASKEGRISIRFYEIVNGLKEEANVNSVYFQFNAKSKRVTSMQAYLHNTYGNTSLQITEKQAKVAATRILKQYFPKDPTKIYRVSTGFIMPSPGYGTSNYSSRKQRFESNYGYAVMFYKHTVFVNGKNGESLGGMQDGFSHWEMHQKMDKLTQEKLRSKP